MTSLLLYSLLTTTIVILQSFVLIVNLDEKQFNEILAALDHQLQRERK